MIIVFMKATVFLTYNDDSEVCFEYNCEESNTNALATLMMVCRGLLMVSMASRVTAYNEDGFYIFSYIK